MDENKIKNVNQHKKLNRGRENHVSIFYISAFCSLTDGRNISRIYAHILNKRYVHIKK